MKMSLCNISNSLPHEFLERVIELTSQRLVKDAVSDGNLFNDQFFKAAMQNIPE